MIYAVPYQYEFYEDNSQQSIGYASTLPVESADDPVEQLRKVVEEVTRKPVERPQPRRIGFVR